MCKAALCPHIKHGQFGTPEYGVWSAMVSRCTNPRHPAYANYGGRGISVCKRWLDFRNFYADMCPRPSQGLQLERANNDGNYEPGNCCWVTRKEQAVNRRTSHFFEYMGQCKTMTDWAAERGLKITTLNMRLTRGWPLERALNTPARKVCHL